MCNRIRKWWHRTIGLSHWQQFARMGFGVGLLDASGNFQDCTLRDMASGEVQFRVRIDVRTGYAVNIERAA